MPPNPQSPRYMRQVVLPELGVTGQTRLASGSVLVVGLGGLGSPATLYLCAAGVGRLGLVDFDRVSESNLQRQILHDTPGARCGVSKIASAQARLHALNPEVRIETFETGVNPQNVRELVGRYDVVIDASDNFGTRFLLNDACYLAKRPLVHGSVYQFEGLMAAFAPQSGGPCYRCLHREPPPQGAVPDCSEAGVLGALCGIVGCWQAQAALRILAGLGEGNGARIHRYDALSDSWSSIRLPKDPTCPLCRANPSILEITPERYAAHACATNASDLVVETIPADGLVVDVREPDEIAERPLAGALRIPSAQVLERVTEIPTDRCVVLVCARGVRSLHAASLLHARGWHLVRSLQDGMLNRCLSDSPSD